MNSDDVVTTAGLASPLKALAGIYKALADETRLQMLALLLEEPELCVCHFERALNISQSKASRHLRYLLNARLLQDRREGVWIFYRLSEDLGPGGALIIETMRQTLDPAQVQRLHGRLESFICSPATDKPTPSLE